MNPPSPPSPETSAYKAIKTIAAVAKAPVRTLGSMAVKAFYKPTTDIKAPSLEKASGLTTIGIYGFLNDSYGRDWWDWEPETLWQTLAMDDIQVDDELKDTVLALQVCVNTMSPFEHWHIFENVGNAFNGNPVSFSVIQPLEPDECALTAKILQLLQPKTPFDTEVLGYIAMTARGAGLVFLPEELFPKGSQDVLNGVSWDKDLIKKTRQVWYSKDRKASDEAVEVQVGRLQEIEDYVKGLGV